MPDQPAPDEQLSIRSYLGQAVLPAISEALMEMEKLDNRCATRAGFVRSCARATLARSAAASAALSHVPSHTPTFHHPQPGAADRMARQQAPRDPRPQVTSGGL